jgi:hypothetical protein
MATNNVINSNQAGIQSYDGVSAFLGRTITGTTNQIAVTNGDGIAGNPTIALSPIVVNTTQPAFLVTLAGAVANVTGDGTVYTIAYDTTSFDQGTNISTNNTFTAPVSGRYYITGCVSLTGLAIGFTNARIDISVNGAQTRSFQINPGVNIPASGGLTISVSGIVTMAAAQTCVMRILVSGSTKTIGVGGDATDNYFCGYLMC